MNAIVKSTPSGQTFESIEEMQALVNEPNLNQPVSAPVEQNLTPVESQGFSSIEEMQAMVDEPQKLPDVSNLEGAGDAAASMAQLAANLSVGGIIGLGIMTVEGPEAADAFMKEWNASGSELFAPETQQGQQFLQDFGEYYQKGMELVRSPMALQNMLYETAKGGAMGGREGAQAGLEQGEAEAERIQQEGIFPFWGDITLDYTGSPEAATFVSMIPETLEAVVGLKGGTKVAKQLPKVEADFGQKLSTGVDNILKNLTNEPELVFIDEAGKITEEGMAYLKQIEDQGGDLSKLDQEIASQLQQDDVLTPEQAQRFNLFKKRGVTPIRSQITQAGDDFIISQELAKGTNPISEILASQDAQLENLARQGQASMGGVTTNKVETNANLFQTFDNIIGAQEDLVFKAYEDAAKIAGEEMVVRPDTFLESVRLSAGNDPETGGLISGIMQDMVNKGIIDRGDKKFQGKGRISVNQAEDIRQLLNAKMDPKQPIRNMKIRELKESLDLDVEDAVGQDIFKDARAAKIELERIKRKAKRDNRDKSKSTLLIDILENKIPEEQIFTKVLSARDDEFLHVKDFLLNESGPAGIQAWQNLKAQVFEDAIAKATGTRGKTEGGGTVFKGNIFNKQFDGMRQNKKYNELFNADERALIEDIAEIDFLRVPKTGTFSGQGPSAQAIRDLTGEVEEASRVSKATLMVLNMLARPVTMNKFKGFGDEALRNRAKKRAEKQQKKAEQVQTKRMMEITKESEKAAQTMKKKDMEGGE